MNLGDLLSLISTVLSVVGLSLLPLAIAFMLEVRKTRKKIDEIKKERDYSYAVLNSVSRYLERQYAHDQRIQSLLRRLLEAEKDMGIEVNKVSEILLEDSQIRLSYLDVINLYSESESKRVNAARSLLNRSPDIESLEAISSSIELCGDSSMKEISAARKGIREKMRKFNCGVFR